jgi:hypothetical protein
VDIGRFDKCRLPGRKFEVDEDDYDDGGVPRDVVPVHCSRQRRQRRRGKVEVRRRNIHEYVLFLR